MLLYRDSARYVYCFFFLCLLLEFSGYLFLFNVFLHGFMNGKITKLILVCFFVVFSFDVFFLFNSLSSWIYYTSEYVLWISAV